MAQIKGEHSLNVSEAVSDSDKKPPKPKRVASLDIFRGLTVAIVTVFYFVTFLGYNWPMTFASTTELMILVDDAGGQWPMIGHAPWNGCNLADFVMPFFLFIVGMAIPLALKKIPNRLLAVKKVLVRTLKLLFWGLLLQGGFSHAPDNLTYGVDMKHIRWCGILQRIALAYLVVALVEIFSRSAQAGDLEPEPTHLSIFKLYYWHWVVGACILTVYMALLYGIYVPDWQFTVHNPDSIYNGTTVTVMVDYRMVFTWNEISFSLMGATSHHSENFLPVTCGVRGKLDPPCNAVGYIDREVLGINHMYKRPAWRRSEACTVKSPYEGPFKKGAPSWCYAPFEPEGILSSISATLSTVIGLHFGHVLIHLKDHPSRLKHWLLMGVALLTSGVVLHFTHAIPLNKQLYTLSYVCVTSGAAALLFSAFYIVVCNLGLSMVDIWGLKLLFMPLKWIGMNAMFVYVMAAEGIFAGFINGWYYDDPHNTLIYWIQKHVFINVWHSRRVGILLYVIFAELLFWAVVAGILHRLGIYWKL